MNILETFSAWTRGLIVLVSDTFRRESWVGWVYDLSVHTMYAATLPKRTGVGYNHQKQDCGEEIRRREEDWGRGGYWGKKIYVVEIDYWLWLKINLDKITIKHGLNTISTKIPIIYSHWENLNSMTQIVTS